MIVNKQKNLMILYGVICFMLLSLLSRLLPEGMFFDGITYAAISRNKAIGLGTFWHPIYSGSFYEHPPLMFFIQSFFYKFLGDSYLVEKFYCFIICSLTVSLIVAFWRLIFSKNDLFKDAYWLPLIIWFIMPSVYWAQVINLLDNTMTIFTLSASYLKLWSLLNKKHTYLCSFLSSALIFLAFLTKGPTALAPLFITLIFYFTYKDISLKKAFILNVVDIIFFILLIGLLLCYSPARHFISTYVHQQIINSLVGKREGTRSLLGHFQLLLDIFNQLLLALVLMGLLMFKNRGNAISYPRKAFAFCFIFALISSLPIMLSIKQTAFYMMPSFPFYALAASILLVPLVTNRIENMSLSRKRFNITLILISFILVTGVAFSSRLVNTIGRDEYILGDFKIFDKQLKGMKQIYASQKIVTDWSMIAYLQRYYGIDFIQHPSDSVTLSRLQESGIALQVQQPSDSISILAFKNPLGRDSVIQGYKRITGNNYVLFLPELREMKSSNRLVKQLIK